MQNPKKILVALRMAYASNRAFLSGIARYRKSHPNWRVTVQGGFDDFRRCDERMLAHYDGVITAQPQSAAAKRTLERCPVPLAVLGSEVVESFVRKSNVIFVRGAAEGIGCLAARHFASLGKFQSYAFVATGTRRPWSESRARGFGEELQRRGVTAESIETGCREGSKRDAEILVRRIAALPKPTALFCAYDARALQVIEACETADVRVPAEASVIGVDNDTSLCDFSNPSLTSIAIDQAKMGEAAAEGLDRLIDSPGPKARVITISDARVVERESTTPVSPAKHLVDRARRFIEANACDGIGVPDVVAHLGVSRALADRRFRELAHGTINAEINRVRLEAVKRLLAESTLDIYRITERCGFDAPQYAKRLFKKTTGLTMSGWRRTNRPLPDPRG